MNSLKKKKHYPPQVIWKVLDDNWIKKLKNANSDALTPMTTKILEHTKYHTIDCDILLANITRESTPA